MMWINAKLRYIPTWCLYIVLLIPAVSFFYQGLTGGLGPEPINALVRELGEFGLKLLILGLAITPLRRFLNLNLLKFRRAIGVVAFVYIFLHLQVWIILDIGAFSQVPTEIIKRPFIAAGMAGFILAVPLAITSNDWSLRRLGGVRWRKLHKIVYAVCLLGGIHFIMLSKGFQLEPLIQTGIIVILILMRVPFKRVFARAAS